MAVGESHTLARLPGVFFSLSHKSKGRRSSTDDARGERALSPNDARLLRDFEQDTNVCRSRPRAASSSPGATTSSSNSGASLASCEQQSRIFLSEKQRGCSFPLCVLLFSPARGLFFCAFIRPRAFAASLKKKTTRLRSVSDALDTGGGSRRATRRGSRSRASASCPRGPSRRRTK